MEIKNVVNQKLHEIHRSRNKVGIVPAILVFLASLYFQRDKLIIDTHWILVTVFLVLGIFIRVLLVGPYFHAWSSGKRFWRSMNILSFFLIGLGWGLHFLDIYQHYGPASQNVSFTLLILVAFITSSATTQMAEPTSYYPFSITTAAMAASAYLIPFNIEYSYVVIFILIFFFFSVQTYKVGHAQLVAMIRAQIDSDLEAKRLNRIINAVPGFVSIIDDECRVYMANASVLNIYPHIVGKKVGEIDNNSEWEQNTNAFLNSEQRSTIYESARVYNGHELFILTQIQKLEEGGAIVVSMKINELVEARNKIREQEAKAQYSAKLASLGEMAAGIAHEVNNPLTIVQGSARLIQSMIKEEPLDRENIRLLSGKMVETSERISKIIRSLKSLSRNGENDPMAPVPVSKIIDECLDISAQRFLMMGIKIRYPRFSPNIQINCREVEIGQVFLNLLGNALDAIKDATNPWIEIKVVRGPKWVDIFVIDSGQGIPVEIQQKIMEPFFTTKELNQGTGLGLSISKNILRAHGGELTLMTDAPNTTFRMRLPAVHE